MQAIICSVDKHRDLILRAERYIWANPETGYKEFKTSQYMEEQFEALGYELVKPEGLTGFCTQIDTGREGPTLLILGELDSIICPTHKEANPETGAVHSCGHHAQCGILLGVAAALKEPGALDGMCGSIRFMAVSAETAADRAVNGNVKGGKAAIASSFYMRLFAMAAILIALAKSGVCNPVAMVVPLVLTRIIITVVEFFRKSGETK